MGRRKRKIGGEKVERKGIKKLVKCLKYKEEEKKLVRMKMKEIEKFIMMLCVKEKKERK